MIKSCLALTCLLIALALSGSEAMAFQFFTSSSSAGQCQCQRQWFGERVRICVRLCFVGRYHKLDRNRQRFGQRPPFRHVRW